MKVTAWFVDNFHYYVVFSKAILFISGLIFSYSLVEKSLFSTLMVHLSDMWKHSSLPKFALIVNLQEGIYEVLQIFFAYVADAFWGLFPMLFCSTTINIIAASYAFNLGERADTYWRETKGLRSENKRLASAAELSRIEELEKQLAIANSKVVDLESRLGEVENEMRKRDSLASERESQLQRQIDMFRADALEAFKRGETHGRAEKEAEFERGRPDLELEISRQFLHSPVFNMANILIGANDLTEGWNRALGQIRHAGYSFDESKLDIRLDPNMQEPQDDGIEFDLNVDGHKFEPLLQDVREMVARLNARPTESMVVDNPVEGANLDASETADEAASEEPNRAGDGDAGQAEMIEALRGDGLDGAEANT